MILKDDVAFRAMDILGISHNNNEIDIYNMYRVLGILTLYRNICAHNDRFICTSHGINIDDYFMDFGKSLPFYRDPNNRNSKLKNIKEKEEKNVDTDCFHWYFVFQFS